MCFGREKNPGRIVRPGLICSCNERRTPKQYLAVRIPWQHLAHFKHRAPRPLLAAPWALPTFSKMEPYCLENRALAHAHAASSIGRFSIVVFMPGASYRCTTLCAKDYVHKNSCVSQDPTRSAPVSKNARNQKSAHCLLSLDV